MWLAAALLAGTLGVVDAAETWRGLVVADEDPCSPYDKARDYPYPQAIERDIVRRLGAVVGPYTGTCFGSTDETDIEHIVATREAHDSGLCARDRATRARFATDLRNLTLAGETLNRQKNDKDAAQWLPARNRCWFAATVVAVRRAYGLTIDRDEAAALEGVLSRCDGVAMESVWCARRTLTPGTSGHRGRTGTTCSPATTTTATAGSRARRRDGTGLRRCGGGIRRSDTCGMATGMGWCVSK